MNTENSMQQTPAATFNPTVPTVPGLKESVAALNPAIRPMVAAAQAKYEAKPADPREHLLNELGNRLERIHATPADRSIDYPQEAMALLEMVEAWAVAFYSDGQLILRDPADDIETLEP